jgi:hypothetical protein
VTAGISPSLRVPTTKTTGPCRKSTSFGGIIEILQRDSPDDAHGGARWQPIPPRSPTIIIEIGRWTAYLAASNGGGVERETGA